MRKLFLTVGYHYIIIIITKFLSDLELVFAMKKIKIFKFITKPTN